MARIDERESWRSRVLPLGLLALWLGVGACGRPRESGWRSMPGALDPALSFARMLEVPGEIRAGTPFEVTVRTVGSSSCTDADGAGVEVEGAVAVVRPMDRVAPDGTVCTMDLATFPRTVRLVFEAPGAAEIVVKGRTMAGDSVTHAIPVRVGG